LKVGVRIDPDNQLRMPELYGRRLVVSIDFGPVPGLKLLGYHPLSPLRPPIATSESLEFFVWNMHRERGRLSNGLRIKPGVDLLPAITETVGRAMSTCAVATLAPAPVPKVRGTIFVGTAAPTLPEATDDRQHDARRGTRT
jgi:hypothetical protein